MTPLSAFSLPTASRLTEISERRLKRWDKTGFFQPSLADPNRRRHYSRIYSFRDIVALRTIRELGRRGVSHHRLRELGEYLKRLPDADWVSQKVYVCGKTVYFTYEDLLIANRPLGQIALGDDSTFDLQPVMRDVEHRVSKLRERSADEIGRIDSDRYIMQGQPVLAGTRIPTSAVFEFIEEGLSFEELRAEFPRLTDEDFRAVIAFHRPEATAVAS